MAVCSFRMPNDSHWIVRTTLANGTIFTAYGDGYTDELIRLEVYVGDLLAIADSELVGAFELRASECFNAACDSFTRSLSIQRVSVGYDGTLPITAVLPDPAPNYVETMFVVGDFECLAKMSYYLTNTFTKIPITNGGIIPPDKDLVFDLLCPDQAQDLVLLLTSSTVYPEGAAAASLFDSRCQQDDTVYEITYADDQQGVTVHQDPISAEDGDTVQVFNLVIAPRDAMQLTAEQLSTDRSNLCHPELPDTIASMLDNGDEKTLVDETGRRGLNESPATSMSYGRVTMGYHLENDSSPTDMENIIEPSTAVFIVFAICVTVIAIAAMFFKYLYSKKAPSPTTKREPDVERSGYAEDPCCHDKTSEAMFDLTRQDVSVGIVGPTSA